MANGGVVGINIEDSIVDKERVLLNAHEFAKTIATIKRKLKDGNIDIFINVRTDAFLLGCSNAIDETKKRIKIFEEVGADGIFVPCIEKEDDIKMIIKNTNLPINVMCMPSLSNFEQLKTLGVKRISMGSFLFDDMMDNFERNLNNIVSSQSFNPLF